jgi:transcriptional regulator with PAS, ATPase and Fis domain
MSASDSDDREPFDLTITVTQKPRPRGATERLQLSVIAEGKFASHVLPDASSITIGRSPDNDVCIDDHSVSRRHAVLHVGDPCTIEDNGSANGTLVRGAKIPRGERVSVTIGEILTLGTIDILLQRRSSTVRHRRVWTHDYFEMRLEEECARAERSSTTFAVLLVETDSPSDANSVREIIADTVRQGDIIAAYGPQAFEVLLVDASRKIAEHVRKRLAHKARHGRVAVRVHIRSYPKDGRTPHALVSRRASAGQAEEDDILVADAAMKGLHLLAERVAASNISVLILGETGVGKEILARTIHRHSPRADKPFLPINCASLSESLLESELFGHEKGAFTNAHAAKTGLFEAANGGTILLDEVGELPLTIQAKVLRVFEDREVRRLGGVKSVKIDVRFVAATNRDLEKDVEKGTFRRDVYYRLNGITMLIPPLRERLAEIEPLARAFASRFASRESRPIPDIAPEALELLSSYSWPGNVRELRNVIERAALLCGDGPIDVSHLPVKKIKGTYPSTPPSVPPPANEGWIPPRPRDRGPEERAWILAALERAHGNQTRAAALLGISRRTLVSRLEEYGFPRPRKTGQQQEGEED